MGKGTIRVCLAFILVDWDHFSPKGPSAAFDFKPCKLYCQTEISQDMRGNDFAIKWLPASSYDILKHRYINQKRHTQCWGNREERIPFQKKIASIIWWCFSKLSLETLIPLPNNNKKFNTCWPTNHPLADALGGTVLHWNLLVFHSSTTGYQDFAK